MVCLPLHVDAANLPAETSLPSKFQEAIQAGSLALTTLEGWQPLHYAVAAGRTKAVEALLDAKALPSAPDSQGMTPLHLAALLGHSPSSSHIVEALLLRQADAAMRDFSGRAPLALLQVESIRYTFEEQDAGFREACAHEIRVKGTGPADGDFAALLDSMGSGPASEGPGTGTAASPEPQLPSEDGEAVAALLARAGGVDDTTRFTSVSPTMDSEPPDLAMLRRPTYRRIDGAPFIVKWTERDGWGLFQIRGQESCVFKSSNMTAFHCPVDGWSPAEGFQMPEGFDAINVQVSDVHPWRAGTLLFRTTPVELHPPTLRQDAEALLPVHHQEIHSQAGAVAIQLGGGISIPGVPGSPTPDQLFQSMMEEMMRRGGPLPMPPGSSGAGGGMMLQPPACPQQ